MKWHQSSLVVGLIFSGATFVINWLSIILYWSSPFLQGWDGEGHASITEYYGKNIFPSVWGWTHNWYLGMPFPQFYPPLFQIITGVLSRLLPFLSFLTLLKFFVTLLVLSLPAVLIWFVAKRAKSSWALWLAGICALAFTSAYFPIIGGQGVSTISTLNTGMISNLLGFIIYIFWLHFFLNTKNDKGARIFSALFLFLIFISSIHVAIFTLITYLVLFFFDTIVLLHKYRTQAWAKLPRFLSLYFLLGFIPLLASAFWTLPLIARYQFFVTMPLLNLVPSFFDFASNVTIVPVVILVSIIVSVCFKNKDALKLSLIALVSLLLMFVDYAPVLSTLPIHGARLFANLFFLLPIIVGLIFEEVILKIKRPFFRWVIFGAVTIIIIFNSGTYRSAGHGGYYTTFVQDRLAEIIQYANGREIPNNTILTELSSMPQQPRSFVIDSLLGLNGASPLVHVLRESSINSVFLTPIRNTFSEEKEAWGFKSYLAFDPAFQLQSIKNNLDRAYRIGLQSFLLRSQVMKNSIKKDNRIKEEKDFGAWTLYSFKDDVPRVEILKYEPVALYADINFKNRDIDSYDWARFQEELLFQNENSVTFASPIELKLDSSADLEKFPIAVISKYEYKDEEKALKKLSNYAQENTLILIADSDPLFDKLNKLAALDSRYHIFVFERAQSSALNTDPLREEMVKIFSLIKSKKVPVDWLNKVAPDISLASNKISVTLNQPASPNLPILIKSSYFPDWKRTDGEKVYLASPGFILTYANSSSELEFETPYFVYLGWIITALVLAGGAAYTRHIFRKPDSTLS